jgi:hypothetical protein
MAKLSHKEEYLIEIEAAEMPDLEKLERMVSLLRNELQEQEKDPLLLTIPENDIEAVSEQLSHLRLGDPPSELHDNIRSIWDKIRNDWACEAIVNRLEEAIAPLLEPLNQASKNTGELEDELELQSERLAVLRIMVDLLDELLKETGD